MDFFKFIPGADPSFLTNGAYINGIRTAMWAERYVEPGEFEFRSPESKGLREFLPVGTMLSKVDSQEVMIVESIELDDEVKEREDEWIIKGRSLETYLEQRVVGDGIETYTVPERLVVNFLPYEMAFDTSWAQAVTLISDHITDVFNDSDDEVAGFVPISNQQHITTGTTQARTLKPQSVYKALRELLAIDDYGIKTVRPNADNVDPTTTEFRIHNGVDRTATVIFSHVAGDLEKTKYFWSDKALKTEYYCYSTYYRLRSSEGVAGFPRRILEVDCTDLDSWFTEAEYADGPLTAALHAAMDIRGQQALRAQKATNIVSTDVSKSTRYLYRKDYEVGDLVTVRGKYDIESIKRVTEYVEFQDENGETGYPTLSALNE